MATPLGTFRSKLCYLFFIAKQYLSYCFPCCGHVEFIKFYFYFFALFTVLACIVIHVYIYILDMDLRPSHITHLIFKICMISTLR